MPARDGGTVGGTVGGHYRRFPVALHPVPLDTHRSMNGRMPLHVLSFNIQMKKQGYPGLLTPIPEGTFESEPAEYQKKWISFRQRRQLVQTSGLESIQ